MVASNQACEYFYGLKYNLRMMVIPVKEPTYMYGDNQYVLSNTTMPKFILKKKSNAILLHFVWDGGARYEWRIAYINTHINVSNMTTNPLTVG